MIEPSAPARLAPPPMIVIVTALAHCERCENATDHAILDTADGEGILMVCRSCRQATVLEAS